MIWTNERIVVWLEQLIERNLERSPLDEERIENAYKLLAKYKQLPPKAVSLKIKKLYDC